ncbi:MAG: hypothetical protein PVH50_08900 [Anaerolineae bacterium]
MAGTWREAELREEYCKSEFQRHLQSTAEEMELDWRRDEAPDYYLHTDGKKYAVEVTTLVERIEVGELELSWVGILASLWDLVDEVEEAAKKEGTLNGTYRVSFSRPIEDLGSIRNQLFQDLPSYVRKTREAGSAPQEIVFRRGSERCAIKKGSGEKSRIVRVGPIGPKWDREIAEEVCHLPQERIDTKRDRLRDLSDPKVLLLYDEYRLAIPKAFESCLDDLEHLDEFHTIFIGDGGPGWVLHSQNPDCVS